MATTLQVGAGQTYETIQAAMTAAVAGDTIIVAAGTYTGTVTVNKDVTILGANDGAAGYEERGPESTLQGTFTVTVDGATISGFTIAAPESSNNWVGVSFSGPVDNVTISNNILDGANSGGDSKGILTASSATASTGVSITDNLFENSNRGMYLNPGISDSVIAGNHFDENGNHINVDRPSGLSIIDNDFGISVGARIAVGAYDNVNPADVGAELGLSGNSFAPSATQISIYPYPKSGDDGQHIIGTSLNDSFRGDYASPGGLEQTYEGGAGDDVYYVDADDTIVEAAGGGIDSVFTADSYTLPDNVENITLLDVGSDTQDFEDFDEGPIGASENGWRGGSASHDQEVVEVDGNLVFRTSSDPAGGDFSGPYSPDLGFTAGEPQTTADGSVHILKFRIKPVSETPDDSRLEVDFGNADGTDRNNFMAIESTDGGIRIAVNHPVPSLGIEDWANDDFSAFTGNIELISGVDPTVWHDIELRLVYKDGANNDVIKVYLDGQFIGETTTFENYRDSIGGTHPDNAEANQTNSIFFRPNAGPLTGSAPQDGAGGENQGFYFDDITNTITNNVNATGNGIDNVITGNSGDNVLNGLGGNDTLIGGGGTDSLNGGDGTDTAVYATALTTGDIVFSGASWWIEAGTEGMDVLTGIERVTHGGVGEILLVGGGGYANRTAAEAAMGANDLLLFASTPGAVADTDAAANSVVEQAANGTAVGIDANATTDGAGGSVTYSLSDDAGGRFAIDATTGVVTVADGALLDYETATSHQITVRATNALGAFSEQAFDVQLQDVVQVVDPGTNGNDTVVGTTEPDVIDGDKGKDTLYGADGDDSLGGGNGKDKVYGGDGQDGVDGGKGKDKLYGGNGDDTLSGGKGADRIQGGDGTDTASYASSSGRVRIDLNNTKQKGGDASGDKLFSIENVTGSEHNDRITGNKEANVLDGAGGNDRLDGQGGTDTLIGGDGRDLFLFKKGYDHDTIVDFGSDDFINLSFKGVDSFKDLKALMTETDGNVVIDFGKGDVLTILDHSIASLQKDDFHF